MKHEQRIIPLPHNTKRENVKQQAYVTTYIWDESSEIKIKERPLILICPGGGYAVTSDREAEAVALRYMAEGFHVVVLRYSVAPFTYPDALLEVAWTIGYFRSKSKEYGIQEDAIYVQGFSAGGHLAACSGIFWNDELIADSVGYTKEEIRPDGVILGYPVITSGEAAHQGSFVNLLGERLEDTELKKKLSLENSVHSQMPPVFLWHTLTDPGVPVENTFLFALAMKAKGVSFELHIYQEGLHGLGLANELTETPDGFGVQKECEGWIDLAIDFIKRLTKKGRCL